MKVREVRQMKYVVTGSQMKAVDQDTIERIKIPSLVLMERAALAVAEAVEELAAPAPAAGPAGKQTTWPAAAAWNPERPAPGPRRILAVCGTGNNGADGIAAGRILWNRGYDVAVLLAGDPDHATGEHRLQQQIARQLGVPLIRSLNQLPGGPDSVGVIVDAVFGIGLCREVTGAYRDLLEQLSAMDQAKVVAVDIPSGIHADTGAVLGTALKAHVTVTFGYRKAGHLFYPGRTWTGRLQVAETGFSDQSLQRTGWAARMPEAVDLGRLPGRRADGNKGTFGRLLVIAGSRGMGGAAYLSGLAAYRAGAGLVKLLTVEDNREILQARLPEAVFAGYRPEQADQEPEAFRNMVKEQVAWADAVVLGPGLGTEPYAGLLAETVLSGCPVPLVVDADGLNLVAARPRLAEYLSEQVIVTPHMGEMVRLTGTDMAGLKADPLGAARDYSRRTGAVCVLKDAVTVTAFPGGEAWINTSGSSAMAKGGSGDVLAGIIGGLLAQGAGVADSAVLGVYVHGLAGEQAAGPNPAGLLAHEIADALGEIPWGRL